MTNLPIKKIKENKKNNPINNLDRTKKYPIKDALEAVVSFAKAKFKESIDVVFALNLNMKKYPEHNLKGYLTLPNPQIKERKICVLTERYIAEVENEKPYLFGGKEIIDEIAKTKKIDFDLVLASSEIMSYLSRLGKLLGPKRLMPNKKSGTLSDNLGSDLKAWKNGRITYYTDTNGNLSFNLGKIDSKPEDIIENFTFCLQFVQRIRPGNIKGKYIKNISLSSTMGPGFKIDWK